MKRASPDWSAALEALKTAGRVTVSAGRAVGRAVSEQVQQIDPDLRQHIAELPLVGLTLLTRRHEPVVALPDDGHRPVVFVHGLGGARGNFLPMRAYFRVMGRSRTYAVGFPGAEPVEALATRLQDYLAEVCRVNELGPQGSIDVVAHSMGGIITRLALADADLASRVATLVTLGTPHGGTWAARFAGLAPATQLRPDSDVVARLSASWAARGEGPSARVVCLWSRADVLMLPAETARLDGAVGVEMPGFTHTAYLLHPRAWQEVFSRLAG